VHQAHTCCSHNTLTSTLTTARQPRNAKPYNPTTRNPKPTALHPKARTVNHPPLARLHTSDRSTSALRAKPSTLNPKPQPQQGRPRTLNYREFARKQRRNAHRNPKPETRNPNLSRTLKLSRGLEPSSDALLGTRGVILHERMKQQLLKRGSLPCNPAHTPTPRFRLETLGFKKHKRGSLP
jgi:hypothetical protein